MPPVAFRGVGPVVVLVFSFLYGCATPAPPMSFAEAGLLPPVDSGAIPPNRDSRDHPSRDHLARATEDLLAAVEAVTGWRLDIDDATASIEFSAALGVPAPSTRSLRSQRKRWAAERGRLALEMLRSTDTRTSSRLSVRRAQAVLSWDRKLGAYRSSVDEHLVNRALARADAILGPTDDMAFADPPLALEVRPFDWPVSPVRITSPYGEREDPLGEGIRLHAGVDLAALEGQRVYAATDGVVTFAGLRGGYGLHVEVRHHGQVVTRYAHLSDIVVKRGMRVVRGQTLGRAGRTGRTTGPHLHFELWRNGVAIDPALEIDGRASRVVTDRRRAGGPRDQD